MVVCEVRADDDTAGAGEPSVDHHLMADAFGEQVGDRVLDAELADDAMQLGGGDGVRRHHVVEVEHDPVRVPEGQLQRSKRLDGERSGDVVRCRDVHVGDHRVAGAHRASETPAEQFLGQSSHVCLPLLRPVPSS